MPILTKQKSDPLADLILSGMKSEREINRNGRLYAGSSGFCERQTALDATYKGLEVTEPSSTGYFALGIAVEDLILDALHKKNTLLFRQLETPNIGINIGGKIDGFVFIPQLDKIRMVEVKSCGTTLPSEPNLTHKAQALIYSGITGFEISLVYYSRNVADRNKKVLLKPFDLGYDEREIYKAMYRACYGYFASKLGVMPRKPLHIANQDVCGFCRFIPVCWQGEKAHLADITPEQQKEIEEKSVALANHILSPESIAQRKNLVLKKIASEGTLNAKELLKKRNWQEIS